MEYWFNRFAEFMWGTPLIVLLIGGGLFFVLYSRALPYQHFRHGMAILSGRYDNPTDAGVLSHFQALSTALSGTLGLGNIAGVALAITMGGPGAIFWMWLTALLGVATKFFTATLSVMYRGRDSLGQLQGGPMYVIREGMGKRWHFLAVFFALAGMCGTLPVFQVNQLVAMMRESMAFPLGLATGDSHMLFDICAGVVIAALIFSVISGNLPRVGKVTARVVPMMVVGYLVMTAGVLVIYAAEIPAALQLIVTDAFSGQAAAGGALGTVIMIGVRRGAFSNEAGIGTEAMAHGAARTNEPVREGLVAMMGPVIDTLIVCTCTALVILITGVWQAGDGVSGVALTASAFADAYGNAGHVLLSIMVIFLSLSTVLTFWYYGAKCLGFLIGAKHQHHYVWIYCLLIVLGSVASLKAVIGFLDGMYAAMAIPTMVSALVLAPRVNRAARNYFERMGRESSGG